MPSAARPNLHPTTWVAWTITAAVIATLTRNPTYTSLLLGVVAVHYAWTSSHQANARGWWALLRIALGLALLIVPFNALSTHGGRHVLFALPSRWPVIGGPVTLEAVLWGASSALSLLALLVLFATFNLAVDQAQVLRLTPAFIYEAGLVVSIALTFVPQMMISAQEIREAQLIRGHRIRKIRDMLPLVIALLTTGLERSFQLAESMEARGFGNVRDLSPRRDLVLKVLTLVGLGGILGGFSALTYLDSLKLFGSVVAVSGAGLLLGVFWAQGRRVHRSRYRRERWTWRDGAALLACLIVIAALALARVHDPTVLAYDPYQSLLPPFQPWFGAALLLLLSPFVVERDRLGSPSPNRSEGNAR